MASIRKVGKKWRAEVCIDGKRSSKMHPTKMSATKWSLSMEETDASFDGKKTVFDLLQHYSETVSPTKPSHHRELNRLKALQRDPIAKVRLSKFSSPDVVEWRDRRLRKVKPNSVRRDWVVLNHACNLAVDEWHWLRKNPFSTVKKPKTPEPRNRMITDDEIKAVLHACGEGNDTITAQVGVVMLFALETAMRASEICTLEWDQVYDKYVHLPKTKNGSIRNVPLSTKARELISQQTPSDPVFNISTGQLDALWRKCRDRALIEDLHFHDTRRTALTRLAKKFNVMDLAKISGHRDLRILQNVYYAPSIDDLADQMD